MLTTSEPLLPDHVARIEAGFGVSPGNSFGSTEGLTGAAPPGSNEFTFASDQAIIEFVDDDDNAVPVGCDAHHILMTSLTNHAQPLIRYRIDDSMTELPPAADHDHQRATVNDRVSDSLTIGGVPVHPLTIRSALLRHESITEYQVHVTSGADATASRVDLALVATDPVTINQIESDSAAALAGAGASVNVTARVVDELERSPSTGKVQRITNGAK